MSRSAEAISSTIKELLPSQIKTITEYEEYNKDNNQTFETRKNKCSALTEFARFTKKPFDKVSVEDIKQYLKSKSHLKSSSLTMKKSIIKSFFKWYNNSEDYPDLVRWIKTGYARSRTRLPESILTPEEVKILINDASCIQHKAMLAVLFDTGCRISELLGMRIEQIQYDNNGAYIVIDGKTGERIVRFIHSMHYLSVWLEHHPFKDCKGSKPLWVSRTNRAKNQQLTRIGAYQIIKEIAEKTNITKKISPHQFRHARITDLARKGLNESTLKVLAGWQGDSSMPKVYIHLSGRDGANQLFELERKGAVKPTIVENPLRPTKCPRCQFESGATYSYCGRCGMPLDEAKFIAEDPMNKILADPLAVLTGLKDAYEQYSTLIKNVTNVLNLQKVMEKYKQITKTDFQKELGASNFERCLNNWTSQGIISVENEIVTFLDKDRIDRYCNMWQKIRGET